jgi:hypothetical protein
VIFGGDYWTRTSGLMRVKTRRASVFNGAASLPPIKYNSIDKGANQFTERSKFFCKF